MIRDAIEKIQDLVTKSNGVIEHVMENGDVYTEKHLTRISKYIPRRDQTELTNLTALVALIKMDLKQENTKLPIKILVDYTRVKAISSLDENKNVETLYVADAEVADIEFNRYMSVEKMIIQLQTNFEDTDNKTKLITKISKLSQATSVELSDDGITQSLMQKSGVTTNESVRLEPLVTLIPKRTFHEVKQPKQLFLLRINGDMTVALFDAAGGAWRHSCQESIREFLKEQLHEEIASEKVIVG